MGVNKRPMRRPTSPAEVTTLDDLTADQAEWLVFGFPLHGTTEIPFDSLEHAESEWWRHRGVILRNDPPGMRPFAWWAFEGGCSTGPPSGFARPVTDDERELYPRPWDREAITLDQRGELRPDEHSYYSRQIRNCRTK